MPFPVNSNGINSIILLRNRKDFATDKRFNKPPRSSSSVASTSPPHRGDELYQVDQFSAAPRQNRWPASRRPRKTHVRPDDGRQSASKERPPAASVRDLGRAPSSCISRSPDRTHRSPKRRKHRQFGDWSFNLEPDQTGPRMVFNEDLLVLIHIWSQLTE